MAAPTSERPRWLRRRAVVVGVLGLVALAVALVVAAGSGGDDDRVAVRSGSDGSGGPAADVAGDEDQPSTSTTTDPVTTTSTTAPTTTTSPSTTTTAAPTTTQAPALPAAPEPTTTTAPAPTTGTLALELAPPEEGWSKDVWVEGPGGTTVLPSTAVTGPIVIEGLAPGTYDVFVSEQGPPYGPDENGVELGGGSQVVRILADVTAGATTTVDDSSM